MSASRAPPRRARAASSTAWPGARRPSRRGGGARAPRAARGAWWSPGGGAGGERGRPGAGAGIVMLDGGGVGAQVASRLEALGAPCVRVVPTGRARVAGRGTLVVAPRDPAAIQALLRSVVAAHAAVAGVV